MKQLNDIKIGDTVWFYYDCDNLCNEGVITDIKTTQDGTDYFVVNWRTGGTSGALVETCFKSREACLEYAENENKHVVSEYKNQMIDMDSLINTVLCNIDNYNLQQAIKERYDELMNKNA